MPNHTNWPSNLGQWFHNQGPVGGALVGAAVAIGLFILTRVVEALAAAARRNGTLKSVLIGLYAEVKANKRGISEWLTVSPNPQLVTDAVKSNVAYRPLVIATYSTDFLKASTPTLTSLKTDCLVKTLLFYDALEEYRKIAQAFESNAFLTLSVHGKVGLVEDFWVALRKTEELAQNAHASFELEYPRRWFANLKA